MSVPKIPHTTYGDFGNDIGSGVGKDIKVIPRERHCQVDPCINQETHSPEPDWPAFVDELAKLGPLAATQRVLDLRIELRIELRELEQSKGPGHGIAVGKLRLAERHLLRVCST